ncbi:Dps family protein [Loigolactobacillus bifermentans]|jgi:starvation-inducible DNA-binding protein|uniref:Ferritin Dps family protein n=1 Tax=Loigolactobacillus bifermentans DSM 20003 TaxID=1423726 RepID=A0A0R1H1N3_9LACO|nr:DNA starvation/stationary phase protection protein [Loigolactobacillus bifermentans]KRK40416.1 ferritin Dps family protein [Loigolactobacillus bifermentans DSM 20003]
MTYDFPRTKDHLNQIIADLSQIMVNVHQTHWYMRGPEFFKLHPKMDEFMAAFDDQLDQTAERLIAIGGSPYSTVAEFTAHTGLPEEVVTFGQYALPDYMHRLVKQFEYLRDVYQTGIEITDDEKDFSTQDMLIAFKTDVDKDIWMIKAFLDQGPLD